MNEISYKMIRAVSDEALIRRLGAFVKHHRLKQNISQTELATNAGVSRSTLSIIERGDKFSLVSLIQVLRALDQLHIFDVFNVKQEISPIALSKLEKQKRKRASKSQKPILKETSEW